MAKEDRMLKRRAVWCVWEDPTPLEGEDDVPWLRRMVALLGYASDQEVGPPDEEVAWERGMPAHHAPEGFMDS